MVFSSIIFIFAFLPITLIIYYVIGNKVRNAFLLFASLVFYAFGEPVFVIVMMMSIIGNYILGLAIDAVREKGLNTRRFVLFVATALNLALLFYYKYFDFFIENVNTVFGLSVPLSNIVLPIGISFFTFQSMSYLFDLYKNVVPLQKNPINLALYIALFPQLIAGPIVRYSTINDQIEKRNVSIDKFSGGVQRFIVGLGKKVIFSNQFAVIADLSFNIDTERSVALAWYGVLAYTIQIYFDFSGYSDMAIGLGKMFGFEFLENFNYPYISKSITEFWRRWHISLSSWFRDYLYIPLGGNRKGNTYVNLLIVFFATGVWHGASWNFIVWGMWHGVFLIIERVLKNKNIGFSLFGGIKWLYTLLVVMLGWVMFRAEDLSLAIAYMKDMFGLSGNMLVSPDVPAMINETFVLLILAVVFAVPSYQYAEKWIKNSIVGARIYNIAKPLIYTAIIIISMSYVAKGGYNPFIYFNF